VETTATPSTSDKTPDSGLYTHDQCGGASGVWTLELRCHTGRSGASGCVVVRRGESCAAMTRPATWRESVFWPIAGGFVVAARAFWRFSSTLVYWVRWGASWYMVLCRSHTFFYVY